jgi:hypothetical protein
MVQKMVKNGLKLSRKYPSKKLRDAINNVVNSFQKTALTIDEVFAIGRKEGFSDIEIGNIVRKEMLAANYDPRTIRRALPSSAKHIEKVRKPKNAADKMSSNEHENIAAVHSNDGISPTITYKVQNPEIILEPSDAAAIATMDISDGISEKIRSKPAVPDQNRDGFDGNRTSEEIIKELKGKVGKLESQLDQERIKNEDLTIQRNNAINSITQLRGDLNAIRNAVNILIITRDSFPPDYGCVFSSQDHVFAVEFKDAKVLDISVMTLKQAREQYEIGIF